MHEIKDLREISVHSLKTSNCLTGKPLNDLQELKIKHVKEKLIEKAINTHKSIMTCGAHCFQIKDKELVLWFNDCSFSTKIMTEAIDALLL